MCKFLREHFLFKNMSSQQIDRLASCIVTKTVNRGAGKTTLVLRAVAENYETTLRRLVDAAASNDLATLRARRMARPLLVKLHGPGSSSVKRLGPAGPQRMWAVSLDHLGGPPVEEFSMQNQRS